MGSSLVRLLSLIRARSHLKIWVKTMASASVCQGICEYRKLRGELTVFAGSGGDLRLLGRDHGVTRDEIGEDTAGSLDAESKKEDIDEEGSSLPAFVGDEASLDDSTVRDNLVLVFLAAEGPLRGWWGLGVRAEPPTRTTWVM